MWVFHQCPRRKDNTLCNQEMSISYLDLFWLLVIGERLYLKSIGEDVRKCRGSKHRLYILLKSASSPVCRWIRLVGVFQDLRRAAYSCAQLGSFGSHFVMSLETIVNHEQWTIQTMV
jgi:hypothetical protein